MVDLVYAYAAVLSPALLIVVFRRILAFFGLTA